MTWMDQTRRMIEDGGARLRRIDYANAPLGYDLHSASPFRWWLGIVTWADHLCTGRLLPASLDSTAVIEGPWLLLLLLSGATAFSLWRFGLLPASLFAVYFGLLFPLSTVYSPGFPDRAQLALACAVWSVLPLLAACGSRKSRTGWFFMAGMFGGLGLWTSVADQLPVLMGIALGALIAAIVARSRKGNGAAVPSDLLPWRVWAAGGSAATLIACLIEYYPDRLGSLDLTFVNPLFGTAWLGVGELLVQTSRGIQGIEGASGRWRTGALALAVIALVALPLAIWKEGALDSLMMGSGAMGQSRLAEAEGAIGTGAWLVRDGLTSLAWATILPVAVVAPGCWVLVRRSGEWETRMAVGLALGPVLTLLSMALRGLQWWSGCDAMISLLVLPTIAAFVTYPRRPFATGIWSGALIAVLVPGTLRLWKESAGPVDRPLSPAEVSGWIGRDIARWLRQREVSRDAIVLAPSHATVVLHHFAGFRGLGTLERDNREGFAAAVRIVNAATFDEAQDLMLQRGVTDIVIPSWDKELNFYSGGAGGRTGETFLTRILHWNLPPWLRPIAYPMPSIPGDVGRSVVILEVTDESDVATSLARLAEYFVEVERPADAEVVARALQRYPGNAGALAARAEIASARGDREELVRLVGLVVPLVSSASGRGVAWDRRVSVAIMLAQGHQLEAARAQYRRCLAEMDEGRLRTLSVSQLYHLHVLGKILKLGIIDPSLHELSLELLPPGVRARLAE